MANTHDTSHARRSQRRKVTRGKSWMSERQLDAYLQARDTLRRVSANARLSPETPQGTTPRPPH